MTVGAALVVAHLLSLLTLKRETPECIIACIGCNPRGGREKAAKNTAGWRSKMPKYLYSGSYTLEGVRGLFKEGGSSRKTQVENTIKGLGGKLEAFYFAFGGNDVFSIIDFPDNISCAAVSLAISAAGGFKGTATVLLSPEDIDQAVKKKVLYRGPGQ
jgi:uncharacterized protein with GYD domain